MQRSSGQNIRLLSETDSAREPQHAAKDCLYLGGLPTEVQVRAVEQRLNSLDIASHFQSPSAETATYWLKVTPASRRLVDEGMLIQLAHDFPQLKNKIMSCEGIASED